LSEGKQYEGMTVDQIAGMEADKMNFDTMVEQLFKAGPDLLAKLTEDQADFWHAATGVVTESCELLDAAKKFAVYQKPLDFENVVEEMGDTLFYLTAVIQMLNKMGYKIDFSDCMRANKVKLYKRFPGFTYSNEAARARADKAEAITSTARKFIGMPAVQAALKEHVLALGEKVTPDITPHPDQTSPMTVERERFEVQDTHPQTPPMSQVVFTVGAYTVEIQSDRSYAVMKGAGFLTKFPEIEQARIYARQQHRMDADTVIADKGR
jgi:NTP pyrophosphatase (non-canonical NTP hydrolase)